MVVLDQKVTGDVKNIRIRPTTSAFRVHPEAWFSSFAINLDVRN